MLKLLLIFCSIFLRPNIIGNNFSYIVVNGQTGDIIESHKANELRPPASITKILTLYLVFDALKKNKISLNTQFKVSKRATQQEPCNLWVKQGSLITVKDIIMALITRSANDMSVVAAEGLEGSVENFVKLMNQTAKRLGMKNSHFFNPTGLPDKRQLSTAKDLAILSQAVFRNFPNEYKLFKTKAFYYKGKAIRNHNRMLGTFLGMDGIKTGFTFASRFNIAVSAVRMGKDQKPVRLFAVVLGGKTSVSRDKKTAQLLEKCFAILKAEKRSSIKQLDAFSQTQQQPDYAESMDDLIYEVESDNSERTETEKITQEVTLAHENDYIDSLLSQNIAPGYYAKKVAPVKKNQKKSLPSGWIRGKSN